MDIKNSENVKHYDDRKDFITYAKEAIGQTPLEIKIKKLEKNAVIPTYAHDGDVGMDLTAISVEYDRENDMYIYHTGIAVESEKHYGIFLFPRSSNRKTNAYLCNHVGIVDSAIYRGEIMFCYKNRTSLETLANNGGINYLFNSSWKPFTISYDDSVKFTWKETLEAANDARNCILDNPMNFAPYKVGDRIGQMVVLPYPNIKITEVAELSETERGSNGFGSTGK